MSYQPFVGQVLLVPFSFAPKNFAMCNGQLLPISQNTALFSLLGTYYGGDGKSTFALPNLNGRAVMNQGQGQGLTERFLGEDVGAEQLSLLTTEIPSHAHTVTVTGLAATMRCRNAPANQASPVGNVPAIESSGVTATYSSAAPDASMQTANPATLSGTTAVTGQGLPHANMQPYLTLNYCIALQGIFPQRP